MKKLTLSQKAIAIPLIGEIWAWVFFVAAIYADQRQNQYFPINKPQPELGVTEYVHASTYLFLIAIAGFAVAALVGRELAGTARKEFGETNRLARAAERFATLALVIGLAFGAIYAIGKFMSAFNRYNGQGENLGIRLLDVYLPILLATALVVFVILRAFVFGQSQHDSGEKDKRGLTEVQKALGLGYAVPILTTAGAIIFGLVVYDITRTNLQVWVWVLIQVFVVSGIVAGTRFASKAKGAKAQPRPAQGRFLAAGAASLNFILSIVFGGVVSIMAFSFGSAAIDKLQNFPQYDEFGNIIGDDTVTLNAVSFDWFLNELLPAVVLLLLAVVGIYWTINARNAEAKAAPEVSNA